MAPSRKLLLSRTWNTARKRTAPRSLTLRAERSFPDFVDAHTHLVFGGNRTDEFAKRTAGATYEQIAASGGGISSTVAATRQASTMELMALGAGNA